MSQPKDDEVSYADKDGDKIRYVLDRRLIKYVNGVKKVGDGTGSVDSKGVVTRISYGAHSGRISDQHGWGGIIPKEHLPVLRRLADKAKVVHDLPAPAKAPKGTEIAHEEYLKMCRKKSFLLSKAVAKESGFECLAAISEAKMKIELKWGAKMGGHDTEYYLGANGFKNNEKLGADQIIANESLCLHHEGLKDWVTAYQAYAAATKYGVLILAKTPENFQVWAKSGACLKEVKGIPKGRLYVYIEHTENDEGGKQGYICHIRSDAEFTNASATVMNGRGYLLYADGGYYQGEIKNGDKHGKGKYTWVSGNVYNGEYKDGKMHGKGEFTSSDGDVYDGYWKNGKKHGKGEHTWASGNVYYGDW